eukprot:1187572-Prorocentrum_minimum.AAC.1
MCARGKDQIHTEKKTLHLTVRYGMSLKNGRTVEVVKGEIMEIFEPGLSSIKLLIPFVIFENIVKIPNDHPIAASARAQSSTCLNDNL